MATHELQYRGARVLLIAASLVVVIAGLRAAAAILLPLLFAIFFTILSQPLMSWLRRHRVPTWIAVLLTVIANLMVVAAALLMVGGSINAFSDSLPIYREQLDNRLQDTIDWLSERGIDSSQLNWIDSLDSEIAEARPPAPFELGAVLGIVGTTLRGIAGVVAAALLILLMMIFILFETAGLPLKLQRAFGWEAEHLERLSKATLEIQRYLGIKTVISLATGVLAGLWVWGLGVDFPLLWGLLAFLLNYIPSLGSIFAAVPAVAITLIAGDVPRALLVALGYLVINMVLGNFLEPHLMGRRFGLSPLVVFLSLVFWGWVWGPLGMLLSVPLTMILKIMLENTKDFRWLARLLGPTPKPVPPGA